MGVGTKYLTSLYCTENTSEAEGGRCKGGKGETYVHDAYWCTVRDSHAEVLARRAFLQYLYLNMQSVLQQQHALSSSTSTSGLSFASACAVAGNGNEVFLPLQFPSSTSEVNEIVFQPFQAFQLRPEVRFHLYTSSQPCGNAW